MFDPISIGIEIAAIVSGAEAAVNTVQKAVQVGKDIHAVSNDIMKFLNGQAELAIKKAAVEAAAIDPNQSENLTALAFDIVLKEKKLKQDEQYLKDVVIYELDSADVWFDMVRKRDELIQKRAEAHQQQLREARLALKAAQEKIKRRKQKVHDTIEAVITLVLGISSILLIIYGFFWVITNWRY